jgi:DNA repair exonuclease SbcCD ATPase subunit
MLLDSSVPQMNQTVSRIAAALSGGELSVSFDPAAAKGRGDAFAVNVTYADGADDYDLTSSGEHTRVDVSVLFTLRDLLERRGSNQCTQLFLDEILIGTDAAFADAFVAMLRSEYAGKSIFVISHDDQLKAQCDDTITVRKVGREAVIAQ